MTRNLLHQRNHGLCVSFARRLSLVAAFVFALIGSLASAQPDHLAAPGAIQTSLLAVEFDSKGVGPSNADATIVASSVAAPVPPRHATVVPPDYVLTAYRIRAGRARAPPSWDMAAAA